MFGGAGVAELGDFGVESKRSAVVYPIGEVGLEKFPEEDSPGGLADDVGVQRFPHLCSFLLERKLVCGFPKILVLVT